MPIILASERLRQDDFKFQSMLRYTPKKKNSRGKKTGGCDVNSFSSGQGLIM